MPSIFVKDDLRASVEAASGGKQTVLYTAAGHPSIMNIIPAFNLEDIDASLGTGLHPAFIVNATNKSELFIGTYQGIVKDGNLLSLPNVTPTVNQAFDTFRTHVAANGPGWHLTSNAERAAIALWCWKNGFQPRGNNNYGRDVANTWETARRADGLAPGYTANGGISLTGSGPASWRHDNTPFGISDLNGTVWEWATGMRIVAGEVQVLQDNNAADNTKDVSATSSLWKAIDGSTGALVTPTFTGTIAGGDYVATTANSVRYAVSGTSNYTLVRASGASFEGMTNPGTTPVGATALQLCKRLGLYPVASSGLGGDYWGLDVTGERVPLVGGAWDAGAGSGVFALHLAYARLRAVANLGARPAYVL
jgi:formylglycine-generating enzyme required for sulfatase activity